MRPRSYAVIAATLALSIAVPLAPGALAQSSPTQTSPAQNAPGSTAPTTMAGSPLAKIPFAVQPFPLRDDGTYLDYMNRIVGESGHHCVKQEQYGWEFAHNDQTAVDKVFQDTMTAAKQGGYHMTKLTAKTITDPETAAYYAVKDKLRLLMVWVPLRDSVLMLMCQAEGSKPVK